MRRSLLLLSRASSFATKHSSRIASSMEVKSPRLILSKSGDSMERLVATIHQPRIYSSRCHLAAVEFPGCLHLSENGIVLLELLLHHFPSRWVEDVIYCPKRCWRTRSRANS